MVLTRISDGFYGEALNLQFIKNGISRTTLVNIGTILTPISIIIACLCNKFLVKGKLIQYYHNLKTIGWVISLLNYWIYIYLASTKNVDATIKFIFIINFIGIMSDQTFNFFFGFVNLIIDEEMGSSSITVMTSMWNISNSVPNTIGLALLKKISFHSLIITCLIMGIVILVLLRKTAQLIDASDTKKYPFLHTLRIFNQN